MVRISGLRCIQWTYMLIFGHDNYFSSPLQTRPSVFTHAFCKFIKLKDMEIQCMTVKAAQFKD